MVALTVTTAQQDQNLIYSFDESYVHNKTKIFKGAQVDELVIYSDQSQSLSIIDMRSQDDGLLCQAPNEIVPKSKIVYWLKVKLAGSESFKGRHIFQVGQEMGNDLHAYDFIDVYTYNQQGHQTHVQTGRKVNINDKPIDFWANLIPVEIGSQDTIDLYIRLEGINRSYPPDSFALWHLDFENLFGNQIYLAIKASLFYGVLGIQIIFFLLLFLIERERIYIYFSIFGLGLFLSRAFSEFNYSSFVPMPSFISQNEVIFHSSVYLAVLGGILFVSKYLEIPKNSKFIRRVVPIYLLLTLIAYLRFLFRYSINEAGTYPALLTPAFYTLTSLFLGVYMIITSPLRDNKTKLILLLAIIPIIIGSIMTILFNESLLPDFINALHVDDFMKIAVILLVVTLALTVGFRSKSLKEEKNEAIQQNLKAQQIIFEEKIKAEKLEEMDELKTKLYTNITHEFRTPLTVIMGINDELTDTTKNLSLPSDKKEKILQNQQLIHRNSKNLLTLVNQLLDLSKSDSQLLELQLIQADIIPYLNYLTESFFSRAKEKDIRLVFYSEQSSLIMDYDEQKIQHIAYNLLFNAIKFTPSKGKIILHAVQTGGEENPSLQLIFKDTGIGISQDDIPFIFDRFYQVDDSHTRQVSGSGIGLSLTKDLVELMGGQISVSSQLGTGTTFTVYLPIKNQANLSDSLKSDQSILHIEAVDIKDQHLASDHDPKIDKPILLIVEDNSDVFSYLKLVLGQTYQIIEATDGQQGIDKAIEYIPDLVISDVMMPIKDGYELTRTLKGDTRTSHIPIILLTAKATNSDKMIGLKTGADAYLSKPFNKEELLIRINQLLESRNALRLYYSDLSQIAKKDNDVQEEYHLTTQTLEKDFLQDLLNIIHLNIKNESLNVDYLSKETNISQSQLYRKVKALTGMTISNFINKINMQKSLELLQNTDKDIAEIAYEVGFNSPSYYSRSFHKIYKKSPLTYRKSFAKKDL